MSNSLQQLIKVYEDLKVIVANNPDLHSLKHDFSKVQVMFEDKINDPDLKIMVYGVYNAGKSTLINAMAGAKLAEVDDVPMTDVVTEYTCGSYKVIDTPGIDAPLEHEEVTIKEMLKADAIIFVVNPIGVIEEQKTLEAMLNLLSENKKVFLVFNEKHALSDEDYLILKEQTYQKIQELAPKYGLYKVLQNIPICKINAKAALTARLQKSEGFLKSTGYIDFESILQEFLDSITDIEIHNRLKAQLLSYLSETIKNFESNTDSIIVKSYDELIRDLKGNRANLRQDVKGSIDGKQKDFHKQIKSWFYNKREDIKSIIQCEVEQYYQIMWTELKDNLDIQGSIIQADIAELQTKIPELNVKLEVNNPLVDESLTIQDEENLKPNDSFSKSNLDLDKISLVAKSLQHSIKVEHMVEGLNAVKLVFPKLMKDIGEEAIEKMAQKTVAKYIPYIGTAVTVALSLRDVFGTDEETKQLMQHQEAEKRAIERWEQQIEDISSEVSRKFASDITTSFYKIIDEFFSGIIEELNVLQNEFSDIDKNKSMLLEDLYDIQKGILSKVG